ncbi:MAG: PEGA domain-containing protein [Tepidisphaerales bacterium]
MNVFVRVAAIVFAGLCCIFAGGCATAVRGDTQKLKIESDPSGATLKVNDQTYTTPAEVALKRKETYKIEVAKAGYRTKVFELKAQWDGASLPGLILPGGSVSVATDRVSGADLSFSELPTLKLDPAPAGTPPQEMVVYRKKVLTKEEYEKTLEEERLEALRHKE